MTRAEAKLAGLKRYATGAPCVRGHVAERQTSNGNCCECDALKARDTAGDVAYRQNNRDKVLAAKRAWYQNNRDNYRAYVRNRSAMKRSAEGTHTKDDVLVLFKAQAGKCAGCACCIENGYHVDHVMPLALGGSNWPSNLQLLCQRCNMSKGAKRPEDWRLSSSMFQAAA